MSAACGKFFASRGRNQELATAFFATASLRRGEPQFSRLLGALHLRRREEWLDFVSTGLGSVGHLIAHLALDRLDFLIQAFVHLVELLDAQHQFLLQTLHLLLHQVSRGNSIAAAALHPLINFQGDF